MAVEVAIVDIEGVCDFGLLASHCGPQATSTAFKLTIPARLEKERFLSE